MGSLRVGREPSERHPDRNERNGSPAVWGIRTSDPETPHRIGSSSIGHGGPEPKKEKKAKKRKRKSQPPLRPSVGGDSRDQRL